jgi:hypothetical protein
MGVLVPGIGAPSGPIPPEARSVMVGLTRWGQIFCRPSWCKGVVPGLALLLCWLPLASAHTGPPTPILVNHIIGPYLVSVWADPEVGTGTFFIRLEPLPGGKIPSDITVHVGIQPLNNRLAEVLYPSQRQEVSGHVQYQAKVPFDAQELWRVRIIVQSSGGSGETTVDVETAPPGLGYWDVLLYLFPFLAIGFLGLQVVLCRRKRHRLWRRRTTQALP